MGIHLDIAENFKDQGNDYFKGKRYREALGFYTQGIDAKPTNNKLSEALLCNRAACNLELRTLLYLSRLTELFDGLLSRKLWFSPSRLR